MNNFTLSQKQALAAIVQAGNEVWELAYNPGTVQGDPEGDAITNGWTQFYKEVGDGLTEVIYTRPTP